MQMVSETFKANPDAPHCAPAAGSPKPLALYDGRGLRRFATMGGAYGNVPALAACVAHAKETGCDGFAFVGDATGCCGHSDETLALIHEHFPFLVAGNHEQKAATGEEDCGCNYAVPEDNRYGGIAHRLAMASLGEENRRWLLALLRTDGGGLLLCHGSPAQTNEFLYESELDGARLEAWLDEFDAKGLVCGHSGLPWVRELPGGRFAVNCGVCGKPDHDHDAAVHYASLVWEEGGGWRPVIERVPYDHLAWADRLRAEGVDDVFTIPLRNGVWTCGVASLPPVERVLRPRPPGWLAAL